MKRALVLVSLLCLVACEVEDPYRPQPHVPDPGSVEGVVRLSDGGVARGIGAELIHLGNGCLLCGWPSGDRTTVATAVADEEGRFAFNEVPVGTYRIELGPFPGYTRGALVDPPALRVNEGRVTDVSYTLHFIAQTLAIVHEGPSATGLERIRATFVNGGEDPVSFYHCWGGPRFSVRDSVGQFLSLQDPGSEPPCASPPPDLGPGSRVEGVLDFGYAWNQQGEAYWLPPGTYTVSASMFYNGGTGLEFQLLEQSIQVDWE